MKIAYLQPVGAIDGVLDRFVPVVLIEEDVSDVLTLRRCELSLELIHGFVPTNEETQRCHRIVIDVLERFNERDEDIFFEPFYERHGTFCKKQSRKSFVKALLETRQSVCCFFGAGSSSVPNKTFTLGQLARDPVAYDIFKAFCSLIPTVQEYRDALKLRFPKDIADKILTTPTTRSRPQWKLKDLSVLSMGRHATLLWNDVPAHLGNGSYEFHSTC